MARLIAEKADIILVLADVFREHGYERTMLSRIHERTGVGRGSLYHFFPGEKEEMAASVLTDSDAWFAQHVVELPPLGRRHRKIDRSDVGSGHALFRIGQPDLPCRPSH